MLTAHPTHRYFLWLALLAVALVVLGFVFGFGYLSQAPSTSAPAEFPADAPAPRPQDYVEAQKGFQYLVSYTENGFTPKTLSVKKGETVRFTNNSSAPLQLTITGAQPPVLDRGEYFEYTFATSGSFDYSDGSDTGSVTVQ